MLKSTVKSKTKNMGFLTQRRERIIIVPRKNNGFYTPRFAYSAILRALQTLPQGRTPCQIEAIFTLLSKWPSFYTQIPDERVQRDICAAIIYEEFPKESLLFNVEDDSDGWYFILSGKCILLEPCQFLPENPDEIPSDGIIKLLRDTRRQKYKKFKIIATKTPQTDFGKPISKKELYRAFACVSIEDTVILRIDPYTFSAIIAKHRHSNHDKLLNLLKSIPKFEPLVGYNEYCSFLVESLKPMNLDKDVIINKENSLGKGFYIIEEGKIVRKRNIDFSKVDIQPEDTEVGDKKISIPTGIKVVNVETLSDNDILTLPDMYQNCSYYAEVVADTKGYLLKYDDYFSALPMFLQKKITHKLLDNSTDEECAYKWIAAQRAIQWRIFRKKCLQEAYEYNRADRNSFPEEIFIRSPSLPISFQGYKSYRRRTTRQKCIP